MQEEDPIPAPKSSTIPCTIYYRKDIILHATQENRFSFEKTQPISNLKSKNNKNKVNQLSDTQKIVLKNNDIRPNTAKNVQLSVASK